MPLHTHNTQGKGYGCSQLHCAARLLYMIHALRHTPDQSGKFTFVNELGREISVGVNQLLDNTPLPIFITPEPIIEGSAVFEPVGQVVVCFAQNLVTSTMIGSISSPSITVQYAGATTMHIGYLGANPGGGVWQFMIPQVLGGPRGTKTLYVSVH